MVSQLAEIVIANQESGHEAPKTLPPAVKAVGLAAQQVSQIANTLAESEYYDFPEIKDEIVDSGEQIAKKKQIPSFNPSHFL